MSNATTFTDAVPSDPAVPGDPFDRLRYHYGMLLGAEDFSVEQREKILRRRLHQALLHGAGTVTGLRVDVSPAQDPNTLLKTQLIVRAGLAVDLLGRDVYVDQDQCLDISGLPLNDLWPQLKPPDGDPAGSTRRVAYVLLRYDSCESQPVPAIAPPCNDPGSAITYSRTLDRFRIDLDAQVAPPPPLLRSFLDALAAAPGSTPRQVLLDFLLDPKDPPKSFWSAPLDVPLLLAAVILDKKPLTGGSSMAFVVDAAENPDNTVRALLPPVQAVAESLFGDRLLGAAVPRAAFQVASWSVDTATQITIALTHPPNPISVAAGTFALRRLDAAGWTDLSTGITHAVSGNNLVFTLPAALGDGTTPVTFQLYLSGETAAPLLSTDSVPLAGLVGDPITRAGRGRDVSIIGTWPKK